MTIDINDAIRRLADCAGCSERDIMHSRRVLPATLRHQLWRTLYDNGMHPKNIAKAFEHHRTTVLYGLRRAKSINDKNGYGYEHDLYLKAMGMK